MMMPAARRAAARGWRRAAGQSAAARAAAATWNAGQRAGAARLQTAMMSSTTSTNTTPGAEPDQTQSPVPPAPENPADVAGMPPPDPVFDADYTTDKDTFEAEKFEAEVAAAETRIEAEPETFGLRDPFANKGPISYVGGTPRKRPITKRQKAYKADPKFEPLDKKSEKYTPKVALGLARHFLQYSRKHPALTVTVELNLDVRKADQMIRTSATLPFPMGSKKRVAVFCGPDEAEEAKEAGASLVGSDELIDKIRETKKINKLVDVVISTPSMVPVVRQVARILGPKGLMPNEKVGTVTSDLSTAIPLFATRTLEIRTDKFGILHGRIGTLKASDEEILANFRAYMKAVQDNKPSGARGKYITNIYIATGQGPGIPIDLTYGAPHSMHFMRDEPVPTGR